MQGCTTNTAALKMYPTSDSDSEPTTDADSPVRVGERRNRFIKKPEDIRLCLEQGCDVNAVNGKGNTLLHIAIKKGDVKNVQLLLEKGAKKDIPNHKGLTALTLAQSINSNYEIFRLLTIRDAGGNKRGRVYEMMILILFLRKGNCRQLHFRIGKNVPKARKFDDVIFKFKDRHGKDQYRLLQAKNIRDDSKKITSSVLLEELPCTENDVFLDECFNLKKYFVSFREMCDEYGSDSVKDVVIFTNIGFDENELEESGIHLDEVVYSDEIMDINTCTNKAAQFRLRIEEHSKLYQVLRCISDSKILAKELLKHVFDEEENIRAMETQDNSIFGKYHVALAREIVDTKKGTLKFEFIKGENISEEAKLFRDAFLSVGLKGDEETFWTRIADTRLKFDDTFGKELEGESYLKLPTDAIENKEVQDFLRHLIFVVNQPNCIEMENHLEKEIEENFNLINTDLIMSELHSTILSSVNEKGKDGWVSWVETRDVFAKAKRFIASQVAGITLEYEKSIMNFDIEYKTAIPGLATFLLSCEDKVFHIIASLENIFLVSIKLCNFLKNSEDYQTPESHIAVALESLLDANISPNVMETFALTRSNLMIIRCDSTHPKHGLEELYNQLLTVINGNSNKKLLLIGESENEFVSLFKDKCHGLCQEEDTQIGYRDLSTKSQEKLKNVEVLFQGNGVRLGDLIDDCSGSVIETSTLIILIKEMDITVGNEIKGLCDTHTVFSQISEDISVDNLADVLPENSVNSNIFLSFQAPRSPIRSLENEQGEVVENEIIAYISNYINKERFFVQHAMNTEDVNSNLFRQFCKGHSHMTVFWVNNWGNKVQWKQVYYHKFYLQRHFNYKEKVIIKKDIKKHLMSQIHTVTFIFSGISTNEEFTSIFGFNENENVNMESIHLKSSDAGAEKCYDEMSENGREVHWIKVERGCLIWKRSSASLKILRDHIDEEQCKTLILKEDEFARKMKEKMVIFTGEPAIGKSTTLMSISGLIKQRNPLHWVLPVILKDCAMAITRIPDEGKVSMKDAMAFFSKVHSLGLNTPLALGVVRHNIQIEMRRPIYIFFDGFDEIDEAQQDKVVRLLRFLKDETFARTWVCTRALRAEYLEDNLYVFAVRLEEPTEIERKEFLREFWRVRLSPLLEINKFTEVFPHDGSESERFTNFCRELLDFVERILKVQIFRFMGVPQQLRMLAEVFLREFLNYIHEDINETPTFEDFDSLHFHSRLFQTKCDIYFKQKEKLNDDYYVRKILIKELTKDHHRLAFSLLFPYSKYLKIFLGNLEPLSIAKVNGIESFGLVQSVGRDGKPYFIHQTFAEYFCASFFVYILENKCKKETHYKVLMQFLLDENFKTENKIVFYFLDLMLVQKLPVHLAVLSEDKFGISSISVKDVNEVDRLGRSALHLVARGGDPQVFEKVLLFAEDIKVQDELGRTPLHYAAGFGHLNLLTSLLALFLITEGISTSKPHYLNKRLDFKNLCYAVVKNTKHSVDHEKVFELEECVKRMNDVFPSYTHFIDCHDKHEKSALHYALEGEHWEFATRLILQGANVSGLPKELTQNLKSHLILSDHYYFIRSLLLHRLSVPDAVRRYNSGHEFNVMSWFARREKKIIFNIKKNEEYNKMMQWLQLNVKNYALYSVYKKTTEYCFIEEFLLISGNAVQRANETIKKISVEKKAITNVLELASAGGQKEIFENLFESLADKSCHLYLYTAARNNQFHFFKYLWEKYREYMTDQDGNTALHAASHGGIGGGSIRIIQYLIENGCDVNGRNCYRQTPLHMAAMSSDQRLPVVKYLVEKGADVYAFDNFGKNPLYYAIENVHFKIIRYLTLNHVFRVIAVPKAYECRNAFMDWMGVISCYVSKNGSFTYGRVIVKNPFFREVILSRDDAFKAFVAKKLLKDYDASGHGDTALHDSVQLKDTRFTRMLLQHGHSYNNINDKGVTPMDLATEENRRLLTLVDTCFKNVSNLQEVFREMCIPEDDIFSTGVATARNSFSVSVLHLIADTNARNAMKYLSKCQLSLREDLRKKGKINAKPYLTEYLNATNLKGSTALHMAAGKGHDEIVRDLLHSGAICDLKNDSGDSPIKIAKRKNFSLISDLFKPYELLLLYIEECKHLLIKNLLENEKSLITAKDKNRMSVLHWAAKYGWLEIVQLLLKEGADIECHDNRLWTPLHHAAEANQLSVVRLLLQNGAVFNVEDEEGCTPLNVAKGRCSDLLKVIDALFHDVHRNPGLVISNLNTLKENSDDFCAAIRTRDDQLNTILHYAANEDYFDVVAFLLKHNAPCDVKNKWSQTPKDLAHHQSIKQLFESYEDCTAMNAMGTLKCTQM